MTFLGYTVAACVGSWGLVSLLVLPGAGVEIFLGMIVPLLLAIGTTLLVERTYTREPAKLTGQMTKAFLGKMLFYGIYVSLMVGVFSFQSIPFVTSLTVYFVGLHLAEALYFRDLFRA
ncbi:MAG: hypothetical protein V3R94_13235 [Acidobacteriota bacterium]